MIFGKDRCDTARGLDHAQEYQQQDKRERHSEQP
jgi:hypothetical protein